MHTNDNSVDTSLWVVPFHAPHKRTVGPPCTITQKRGGGTAGPGNSFREALVSLGSADRVQDFLRQEDPPDACQTTHLDG